MASRIPIIFIVGPTASGKTALAIELAEKYNGEIICADSRTVYKGMDIGTAKPTLAEQARVPHWGIDLVEPTERFTVADFKQYAVKKVEEIRRRGNVPFVVGGTGLYVNSVLYDFQFKNNYDQNLRDRLTKLSVKVLQDYCLKNNITLPENKQNKRYLIRAIEKNSNVQSNSSMIKDAYVVGIATTLNGAYIARIAARAEHLFENGVVEEATMLGNKYGWESEAMTGNIYRLVRQYVEGEVSIEELKRLFINSDRQLAKRQLTWFRRDKNIQWCSLREAKRYIGTILSEY